MATTSQTSNENSIDTNAKVLVVAGQDLFYGLTTYNARTPVINMDTVFWKDDDVDLIIEVSVNKKGFLVCSSQPDIGTNWLNYVRLAKHCQMQNLQIIFDECEAMQLQVIKPIRKGENLYAWFSMDTAKIFHIPFLAPKNILDDRNYNCHQCGKAYEDPNPLKIHLRFYCTSQTKPDLVNIHSDKKSAFHRVLPNKCLETHLQLPFPIVHTSPTFHSNDHLPNIMMTRVDSPLTLVPNQIAQSRNLSTSTTEVDSQVDSTTDLNSPSNSDNRKRHQCLYCGKLYSRKYGLKIHIRTHTGYKPLKCKVCFRPFGDPSNLNKHVRLHAEGVTPYKCQLCGKVLVRRRDLERHLRSRHPTANQANVQSN
ncbi:hypothetical protein CHUAL_012399 [Chamberlinius hualienensis]